MNSKWLPISDMFIKSSENGLKCPKCCKQAKEKMTKHESEYGGTKVTHYLRCECGQLWAVFHYVNAD